MYPFIGWSSVFADGIIITTIAFESSPIFYLFLYFGFAPIRHNVFMFYLTWNLHILFSSEINVHRFICVGVYLYLCTYLARFISFRRLKKIFGNNFHFFGVYR